MRTWLRAQRARRAASLSANHPGDGSSHGAAGLRRALRERSAGVDGVDVPFKPTLKDELDASNFETFEEMPDEPYHDDGTGWDEAF